MIPVIMVILHDLFKLSKISLCFGGVDSFYRVQVLNLSLKYKTDIYFMPMDEEELQTLIEFSGFFSGEEYLTNWIRFKQWFGCKEPQII